MPWQKRCINWRRTSNLIQAGFPGPQPDLKALLDAIIAGDGHRRHDGRACVVQKDRRFLDVLQMLALRLGWRTQIRMKPGGCHVLYITERQWLTLRGTNGSHAPVGREAYQGIVWCPSVASTFWLARRDGRTFITGNTFPPKLVEPCVLAGTSAHGCCVVLRCTLDSGDR